MSDRNLERDNSARRLRLLAIAALVWTLAACASGPVTAQESQVPKAGVTPAEPPAAPAPPAAAPVSKEVYQGWKWYHVYCYRCHGTDANAGVLAPDLKGSVKALSKEAFFKTIQEGRLPKGMPGWGQLLSEKQVEEVYAYVKARSDGTLKEGRPDEQQASSK